MTEIRFTNQTFVGKSEAAMFEARLVEVPINEIINFGRSQCHDDRMDLPSKRSNPTAASGVDSYAKIAKNDDDHDSIFRISSLSFSFRRVNV